MHRLGIVIIYSLIVSACQPDGPYTRYSITLPPNPPGNKISGVCKPTINYQTSSVSIGGFDIPFTKLLGGDIKVGTINVSSSVARQASDAIEALDYAQYNYCIMLPLIAQDETALIKMWQDYNTQQIALSTLLRNLNTAQNITDVTGAVNAAKGLAATASSPPPTVTALAGSAAPAPAPASAPSTPKPAPVAATPPSTTPPSGAATAIAKDVVKAATILQTIASTLVTN